MTTVSSGPVMGSTARARIVIIPTSEPWYAGATADRRPASAPPARAPRSGAPTSVIAIDSADPRSTGLQAMGGTPEN